MATSFSAVALLSRFDSSVPISLCPVICAVITIVAVALARETRTLTRRRRS